MKCPTCGTPMQSAHESYRYDESGLPNVTLNSIEVRRCPECGEVMPVIPRIDALHRALARAIIDQPAKICGSEVRFLRKYLGYSSEDFAALAGVARETLSRWENDKEPIGTASDRLLRLLVVQGKQVQDYNVEQFRQIDESAPKPRFRVSQSGSQWLAQAVA